MSSSSIYDVIVIGGGPGGYVSAIKAGQFGLKVACIEKRGSLGGTCLNVGCIPSKALLNISHQSKQRQNFNKVFCSDKSVINPSVNWDIVQKEKQKIVTGLTKGIEFLFKKNKVDYIIGNAKLTDQADQILVNDQKLQTKNVVIATGSVPSELPQSSNIKIDEQSIVSSTGALALKTIPKKMVIIGAGVIGLELGSVYSRLGTQIEVVEYLDRIVPTLDEDVSKCLQQILEKDGLKFHLRKKVIGVRDKDSSKVVKFVSAGGDTTPETVEADIVLVAVGRRPYTDGLGLDRLNIQRDKLGRIIVDQLLRTPSCPSIRAIGDVIPGPMLAHKAEEEGVFVARSIAKVANLHPLRHELIPSVIYTHPEIAMIGFAERELKEKNIDFKKVQFSMAANSRARANNETTGFVKLLIDRNQKILGASIIGDGAGDLIHIVGLAMTANMSSATLSDVCFAHPTVSEAIKEAALSAAEGKAIHS